MTAEAVEPGGYVVKPVPTEDTTWTAEQTTTPISTPEEALRDFFAGKAMQTIWR